MAWWPDRHKGVGILALNYPVHLAQHTGTMDGANAKTRTFSMQWKNGADIIAAVMKQAAGSWFAIHQLWGILRSQKKHEGDGAVVKKCERQDVRNEVPEQDYSYHKLLQAS